MRDVDGFVRSRAGSCEGPGAAGAGCRLNRLGGRTYGESMPAGASAGGHIAGGVQQAALDASGAMAAALKYEHDIISS